MEQQGSRQVLLIHPFGNSDLAFNGEATFPRGEDFHFRAHLDVLKPLCDQENQSRVQAMQLDDDPFPSGLDFTAFSENRRKTWRGQQEFTIHTVRFPILFDTLRELSQREARAARASPTPKLILQPIVTDQDPPHSQDTVGIPPLLETYVALLNQHPQSPFRVECRQPWKIEVKPIDYDALLGPYGEFYEQARAAFEGFEHVYFSLATGTPQMGVAAGLVFAPDPRITFIYKPRGATTLTKVSTFRERVRQETVERLKHLLDRFEFAGALEVLRSPKTGFTPQEIQEARLLLQALAAWQNYDFQQAAQAIRQLSTIQDSLRSLKALCQGLAQEDPPPDQRSEFWRMKLADTVMRLEIAVYRRDLPAVLTHFYNYNDVCLAWGLSAHFPDFDPFDTTASQADQAVHDVQEQFRQRCPGAGKELKSERGKFQLLFALAEMKQHKLGKGFTEWLQAHELLRWFQDTYVDSKRNRLVHGSVQLQEKLFDQLFQDRLQEWDVHQTVEEGQGPWLLLGLTYSSCHTLPPNGEMSTDLVRDCGVQVWRLMTQPLSLAPSPPGWSDWSSHIQPIEPVLGEFESQLKTAFDDEIDSKQRRLGQVVEQWKKEVQQDIRNLSCGCKYQMLANLTSYHPPEWGHYMTQRFINDDPQEHQKVIKSEMLAGLHPCLDYRSEWGQKPEISVGSLIGNYLSGALAFPQLFETLCSKYVEKSALDSPALPEQFTWHTGTVKVYCPNHGRGWLVANDQDGEKLSFTRDAIEGKGYSPGKGHHVRYATVICEGRRVVVKLQRL